MGRNRITTALLAAAVAIALAGCGKGKEVGDAGLLGDANGSAATRLGEATTTTTAPPSAQPAATTPVTAARTNTTARATAATTQAVALSLTINGDSQGKAAFDPPLARIYAGTCAKWTNTDSKTRTVLADGGGFDSGPIAAGATWIYCPKAAGKFPYHDGTRPYAVGTLEVLAR